LLEGCLNKNQLAAPVEKGRKAGKCNMWHVMCRKAGLSRITGEYVPGHLWYWVDRFLLTSFDVICIQVSNI